MERLTNTGINGEIWITDNDETRRIGKKEAAYKKLKAYEDAEEQGLLLRFPCKVGDTVFADSGCFGILEYEVDEIIIEKSITYRCSAYSETIGDCPSECLDEIEPDISYFGKTVFLTRGEAEAKLKEMEDINHDGE